MEFKKSPTLKTESGTQLFARLNARPSLTNIEPILFSAVNPGDVIEICGEAGCGKTEMLYHFIVRCIFPNTWKGIELGGLDTGVVFFDNDYHFNLFRLISIIEKKIYRFKSLTKNFKVTDSEISEFVNERLRLLHVVKCSSTEQFIITLYSMENMLASNATISCIMIDSISAFYWIDRMNVMHQLQKLEQHYKKLILMFRKLISDYSLTVFATKQNLMKKTEKANQNEEYDFMGRLWQKFVTHNVELLLEGSKEGRTLLQYCHTFQNNKLLGKCLITDEGMIL